MQINGSPNLMNSALQTIYQGEQSLMKASSEATSGGLENLAQTLLTLHCAEATQSVGVRLAIVDQETTGFLLDILA